MPKRRKEPLFELGGFWIAQERGSDTFYRYWYSGVSQRVSRKSLGTADFEEAKTQLARYVITRPPEDGLSPKNALVTAILTHYWQTHSDATPSAAQARRAGELLVEWIVDARNKPAANAADFSIPWQHEFIKWLSEKKNHAVGTISREMSIIAAAFNHAVKRIVIDDDNLKREVQLLKYAVPVIYKQDEISRLTSKPVSEPREWTPRFEELAMFIDTIGKRTAGGTWDKNSENLFRYVVCALNTWARPEAILQLHVPTQVDFEAGILRLNPPQRKQTKKVRPKIPLTDNLAAWLKDWGTERPIHRNGMALKSVKKVFKAHAVLLGMPKFTPYALRHFMATNIRHIDGCDVTREQRQEWLGHKPQDTTSWYEHSDVEWLREAKIATDKIMIRINGLLKTRTLLPITSQATPKEATDRNGLKLVASK